MNKKLLNLSIILMLMVLMVCGCTSNTTENPIESSEYITITDMFNREVTLKSNAKKVVAIGPGALRLYCYIGNIENLVGIEQIEKDNPMGRPYFLAKPSLSNLDVIGPGGPNNSPDFEKILAAQPDVIFTSFYDEATIENLHVKTGIPVVALSYGKISTFDPCIYESLEIIGKIIGEEERASEVVNFIKESYNDLNNRTKDVPDDAKPSAYIGALNYKGSHGIESTYSNYELFEAINADNVVKEIDRTGSVMIDKEKLIEWDPDIIFIDYGGLQLVKDDYTKNPNFYNALSAFKNGNIYSQLPYKFYNTNIDTALADAYYLGKVLYPEEFKDIDSDIKADEIFEFFVGKKVYTQMAKDFGKFKKLTIIK